MPLQWKQAEIFTAKGPGGNYFKVYPMPMPGGPAPGARSSETQYAAAVSFLGEEGNMLTQPIGNPFKSAQEAKDACEAEFTKAVGKGA